jgi:CheY-like chemotaxis protein/AraC-like DNA-binding protein
MSYSDIGRAWTYGRLPSLLGELFFARRTSRRRAEGTKVADSTRPTLLSVDDEQSILDLIRIEFEDDFDVVTATSGAEALDLLAHRHVDVVLLDLRMPDMEGEEVLRRLNAARAGPPVVVVSVVRQTETVVECMRLGAVDYVTKPWERDELRAAIRRSLRPARATPGVLLVSDDAAALVPVQLALQLYVRATAMSVAAALAASVSPLIVVLYAPDASKVPALSALSARFPGAAVVWVSNDTSINPGLVALPNRLDLVLDHVDKPLGDLVPARAHLSRALVSAVELMIGHCRDPLTVDDIARRVGVSEDHLIRIFRQAFGLPAATYYVRMRIAVACRLLSDTDEKMDDVARRVGYSGAANFSRAFNEVMGIRPSEYRARRRHGG